MSKQAESQMITRRRLFSLCGIAAAVVVAPTAMLSVSEAEAETVGSERRQNRREDRRDRRHDRRENRHNRREDRRDNRQNCREDRRSGQ